MMLILTRKKGQGIVIGDHIYIQVLGVDGNHVRIGIEAPDEIPVYREELLSYVDDIHGHTV